MTRITHDLSNSGNRFVIGVDEAGRGPLAGPVVAAAVVLCDPVPVGLNDSKKLTARRRAILEGEIKSSCHWSVGVVDVEDIDRLNIFVATMLAMTRAVDTLVSQLQCDAVDVLIDGNMTPAGRCAEWRWNARAIVGGDALEPCISAASIIAKEHRDAMMRQFALDYPAYGWERNAGYGTRQHLEALRQYGITPHHRRSFAPVKQLDIFA